MAAAAEELDVDGIAVRLSNPDKVYFPKLGSKGTKRRLVEYYLAVSGGPMLSSLRDRPTHLQRFPDGIDGEEIYQKRVPQHHPDYLETCRVTFPSGRTADALKVTNPAAMLWTTRCARPRSGSTKPSACARVPRFAPVRSVPWPTWRT
jgi:DNA primase